MTPAERIKQLEEQVAEQRAIIADREHLLDCAEAFISGVRSNTSEMPQEARSLTFLERYRGAMPPMIGVGISPPLNSRNGLESIGNIINRRTAGK